MSMGDRETERELRKNVSILFARPASKNGSTLCSMDVVFMPFSGTNPFQKLSTLNVMGIHQVPELGPPEDAGAPREYLHSSHAEHLSIFTLLSRVQRLQDQVFDPSSPFLGRSEPHASQARASGCTPKALKNYQILEIFKKKTTQ